MRPLSKREKVILIGSALLGANCNDKINMAANAEPFGQQVAKGINTWLYEACEEGHGWMNALVRAALRACGYNVTLGVSESLSLSVMDIGAMNMFVHDCAPSAELIALALDSPPTNEQPDLTGTTEAQNGGD